MADYKAPVKRIIRFLPTTFVLFLLTTKIFLVLFAPPNLWIDTLFDDAYYYLGVARHISLGDGSMFAPPLETNGYQPLWLLILSAASFLVRADRHLLAAMALLISAAVITAFFAIAWRQERKVWPAALAVIAFPAVFHAGMETVLIPPLALLYFRASGLKRGVLASLICMSRLDAIDLILGREAYQLLRTRTVDVKAGAILTATIVVYASVNYFLFGTPVPVSGLAKSIGNVPGENWRFASKAIISSVPVLSLLALGLLDSKWTGKLRNPVPIFASLAALGCSVAYYSLFSGWPLWDWYLWPLALLLYFSLLEKVDVLNTPVRTGRTILLAAIISVGLNGIVPDLRAPMAAAIGLGPPNMSWGQANVRMAERISSSPLISATFAMGDRAGSLGYLLPDRVRFVQTEGLVADIAYLRSLRDGSAADFLARMPVDYLIVDRGRVWVIDAVFAVPEPTEGLSARRGVMLLCFPRSAESYNFGSPRPERKVFVFAERVTCPADAVALFSRRQQSYGEISRTSQSD